MDKKTLYRPPSHLQSSFILQSHQQINPPISPLPVTSLIVPGPILSASGVPLSTFLLRLIIQVHTKMSLPLPPKATPPPGSVITVRIDHYVTQLSINIRIVFSYCSTLHETSSAKVKDIHHSPTQGNFFIQYTVCFRIYMN